MWIRNGYLCIAHLVCNAQTKMRWNKRENSLNEDENWWKIGAHESFSIEVEKGKSYAERHVCWVWSKINTAIKICRKLLEIKNIIAKTLAFTVVCIRDDEMRLTMNCSKSDNELLLVAFSHYLSQCLVSFVPRRCLLRRGSPALSNTLFSALLFQKKILKTNCRMKQTRIYKREAIREGGERHNKSQTKTNYDGK